VFHSPGTVDGKRLLLDHRQVSGNCVPLLTYVPSPDEIWLREAAKHRSDWLGDGKFILNGVALSVAIIAVQQGGISAGNWHQERSKDAVWVRFEDSRSVKLHKEDPATFNGPHIWA